MTTTDSTPRAAWTRCNACQEKVENDRHEINIHKLNCPHRLQLQIQALGKRIKELEHELENLDEQLTTDPDIDPNAVAPWPDDDDQDDDDTDDDEVDGEAPEPSDDDYDDELPARPTSLYSPGTGPLT